MSLLQAAIWSGAGVRWHVYRAPIRQPRFGEDRRDVMRWHSCAYLADTAGLNRVYLEDPYQARSLGAAHLRARNECRRFYRRTPTR